MIKDKDITSLVIAKYFLTKKSLTPKKIQKLVYYAYSWFIALNNQSENQILNFLFNNEEPEAWIHGPVFPKLYRNFKDYNWNEVPKIEENIIFENDDVTSFLDDIWSKFGGYSADELEYMTHQETPWLNVRKNSSNGERVNQKISAKDIFNYYNAL